MGDLYGRFVWERCVKRSKSPIQISLTKFMGYLDLYPIQISHTNLPYKSPTQILPIQIKLSYKLPYNVSWTLNFDVHPTNLKL